MLTEGLKTIILSLIKIKTGYFKIYRLNSFTSPNLETNNIIYFTQEKKGKKEKEKKKVHLYNSLHALHSFLHLKVTNSIGRYEGQAYR